MSPRSPIVICSWVNHYFIKLCSDGASAYFLYIFKHNGLHNFTIQLNLCFKGQRFNADFTLDLNTITNRRYIERYKIITNEVRTHAKQEGSNHFSTGNQSSEEEKKREIRTKDTSHVCEHQQYAQTQRCLLQSVTTTCLSHNWRPAGYHTIFKR